MASEPANGPPAIGAPETATNSDNATSQADVTEERLDTQADRELDAEITTEEKSRTDDLNSSNPSQPLTNTQQLPDPLAAVSHEPRIPQKKDASLREFLGKMDDYAPLIPDAVTDYYLTLAGLPPPPETDRRLARLLALATQKFVADIAADAYQYSRIRSTNTTSNNPLTGLGGAAGFGTNLGAGDGADGAKGKKDAGGKSQPLGGPRTGYGGGGAGGGQGRTVLTMEDLGMAVGEYGVNVKRGEFYR